MNANSEMFVNQNRGNSEQRRWVESLHSRRKSVQITRGNASYEMVGQFRSLWYCFQVLVKKNLGGDNQ